MRIPIALMALTLLALVLAALVAFPAHADQEQEPDIENILKTETAVLIDDPQIRLEVSVPVLEVDLADLWKNYTDEPLVKRLAIAVLRSRSLPKSQGGGISWERCGAKTPPEQLVSDAAMWSAYYLAALELVKDETGVQLPVWGPFATMANEGGFNECSLNFEARRWAAEKKIVKKFQLTYDRETVWAIITHPDFAKGVVTLVNTKTGAKKTVTMRNAFDGGVWQLRKSMKNLTREEFDDLTSVVPGIYLGAREMADRALDYSKRYRVKESFPRPWMLWPGSNPYSDRAFEYDDKIGSVARWLGATREEIYRANVEIVNVTKRKRKYVIKKI